MRIMFILSGAPGCGKSTFITRLDEHARSYAPEGVPEEVSIRDCVVSFDDVRDMMYPFRSVADEGGITRESDKRLEKRVVDMTRDVARSRMLAGHMVIVDNTNTKPKDVNYWVTQAHTFGYTPYIVDCQDGLTVEDVHARNMSRGRKAVPAHVVDRMFDNASQLKNRMSQHVKNVDDMFITPDQAVSIIDEKIGAGVDTKDYDQVVIFGDVHGHYQEVMRVAGEYGGFDNPRTMFIFVGDMFDRAPTGDDVVNMWDTVIAPNRDNVIIVEGNHEHNIMTILAGNAGENQFKQTRKTMNILAEHGVTTAMLRRFVGELEPAVIVRDQSCDMFVSHAGTVFASGYNRVVSPATEFVYGTSERDKVYRGTSTYSHWADMFIADHAVSDMVQVHGHRNKRDEHDVYPDVTYGARSTVVNVEAGVTDDAGHLRYVVARDMMEPQVVNVPVVNG